MSQGRTISSIDGLSSTVGAGTVEAENLRRLQDLYRAIICRDFVAVVDVLSDDVEMEIIAPPALGLVCCARGRALVLRALEENFAKVEDQQPELVSWVAQGNEVIVIAREKGRHRATGQPYDLHWAQRFELRDGKIVRFLELVAG